MVDKNKIVLVVEDDEGLIELLGEILIENKYQMKSFQTGNLALEWLWQHNPFLMIVDYGLPDMNGKELILKITESGKTPPPFIVSTGQGDERIAVEMMKLGALDYIVKDNSFLEFIPLVIRKADTLIESENNLQEAQNALLANETKQRAMISNIADVIAIVDRNGYNRYKSPNIERLFGWHPEELIGKLTFENVHPDDIEIAGKAFTDVMEMPELPVKIEFRYKCKDGSFKWIELTASNQINNPAIKGVLLNYHDISPRKEAEAELIMAKVKAEESDRLKTAFLQNMSHEIRTPMNAIMGFSSLLIEKFNNKQKIIEYSEIINQRCNDLLDIINDILDISKIESGQLKVNLSSCNITELFSELTVFFENQKRKNEKGNIQFIMNMPDKEFDIIILTDKVKLRQILLNLIGNAFKFTDSGKIESGCQIKNQELIFYVTDTGMGIPADKFEAIFDRFTQLQLGKDRLVSGTGLGLSIVKGLVHILGGKVWLDSHPGKGSTFYFSLPYIKEKNESESPTIKVESKKYWFPEKTILIVEDDYFNAEYLKEILLDTGLQIMLTEFGREAIQMAMNNSIDLILMDVRLPDINGYEATAEIKKHKPDIKIIAQTAYASVDEKNKALAAGCTSYISKPTRKADLLILIDQQLK